MEEYKEIFKKLEKEEKIATIEYYITIVMIAIIFFGMGSIFTTTLLDYLGVK